PIHERVRRLHQPARHLRPSRQRAVLHQIVVPDEPQLVVAKLKRLATMLLIRNHTVSHDPLGNQRHRPRHSTPSIDHAPTCAGASPPRASPPAHPTRSSSATAPSRPSTT